MNKKMKLENKNFSMNPKSSTIFVFCLSSGTAVGEEIETFLHFNPAIILLDVSLLLFITLVELCFPLPVKSQLPAISSLDRSSIRACVGVTKCCVIEAYKHRCSFASTGK